MRLTPLIHPKSTVAKWEVQKQCGLKRFVMDRKHARTKAQLVSLVSHAEAFASTPEGAILHVLC